MEKVRLEIGSYIIEYPCDKHGDYYKVTNTNYRHNAVKYICGGDFASLLSFLWIDNSYTPQDLSND